MKKVSVLFVLVLSLILIFMNSFEVESRVTGEAVNQPSGVSVFILPSLHLNIISPTNGTYLTNSSLLLNFSSINANNFWFNLDGGNNLSVTSPFYFNTTSGNHTLFLFANNSAGAVIQKNVSFTVNTNLLIIDYTNYTGNLGGNSTNFYSYSYGQLINLSGICLENVNYGKICFNVPIDVILDLIPNDGFVEINNNTVIIHDLIGLNAINLPNFDKPATVWIYNLTFTNPRILREGSPCSSSICTYESYISGILKFNVTGFSYYSADETPSNALSNGGSAGGGKPMYSPNVAINASVPIPPENVTCSGLKCKNVSVEQETPQLRFTIFGKQGGCCLFGICWFRFIFCWYWWILMIILLLIIICVRRINKYFRNRRLINEILNSDDKKSKRLNFGKKIEKTEDAYGKVKLYYDTSEKVQVYEKPEKSQKDDSKLRKKSFFQESGNRLIKTLRRIYSKKR